MENQNKYALITGATSGIDYELALNNNRVVSGLKNKILTTFGNVTPDIILANQMNQQQKPVDED